MSKDLVSIITPTYNSEKFLLETIECVLNQTYSSWEWLITDDASTDGTLEILKKYSLFDKRIKVFFLEKNMGSGFARNNSIRKAKGKFITFIDSDDLWSVEKLEKHLKFIKSNNLVFSHASYSYVDEKSVKLKNVFNVSKYPIKFEDLLKKTEISCLTAIYDQSLIGKFYMSTDRRRQDYFLWLSILRAGYFSLGFSEVDSYYRLHSSQVRKKSLKFVFEHFLFLKRKISLNYFQAFYYTLYYLFNGFKRYII
jgi:teichuronic acid biosynthesis glycosyltransferase TuaG